MNRRELLVAGVTAAGAKVFEPLARVARAQEQERVVGGLERILNPGEILVVTASDRLEIFGATYFAAPDEIITAVAGALGPNPVPLKVRGAVLSVAEGSADDEDLVEFGRRKAVEGIAQRKMLHIPTSAARLVAAVGYSNPETGEPLYGDVKPDSWVDSSGNLYEDPKRVRYVTCKEPKSLAEMEAELRAIGWDEIATRETTLAAYSRTACRVAPAPAPRVEAPAPRVEARVVGFPTTREEAASAFGKDEFSKDPNRWELSADGGWHFKEGPVASSVDPKGFVLEGYRDTKPGKNADAFVSNGIEVSMQGGTIWPERGEEEARKLLAKKSPPDRWDDGTVHPPRPIGFSR